MIATVGRAHALAFVLFLAALAGCSTLARSRAPTDTPEQAFERLQAALEKKDWPAVYAAAVSPRTEKLLEQDFNNGKLELVQKRGADMMAKAIGVSTEEYFRMSWRDFFIKSSALSGKPTGMPWLPDPEAIGRAKIVQTKIEGGKAKLVIEIAGDPQPRGLRFIREGDRWYYRVVKGRD